MIAVEGGKVWCRIVGGDRPGIPLMILHGGPGAPHDYLEGLEVLADQRPVVFYDQLGCGNSERPNNPELWNTPRFVRELNRVIQELEFNEVHLLGQSWGSMLAVEYLIQYGSGQVKSLILSGPYLSTPRFMVDQRRHVDALPDEIRRTILKCEENRDFKSPAYQQAMMEFYRRHVCRLDPWPDCLLRTFEKTGESVYHLMWGPSEFTVTGSLLNADLTPRLGSIAIPVMLTCGQFDEVTPKTTEYYASLFPKASVYVFPDASHEHHLEQPELFIKVIVEFLELVER